MKTNTKLDLTKYDEKLDSAQQVNNMVDDILKDYNSLMEFRNPNQQSSKK